MLKYITAAAVAATMTSAAIAQSIPTGSGPGGVVNTQNPDGFMNRGQCESALAREINNQRMDAELRTESRQSESTSEFQLNMRDRFYCGYSAELEAWVVYTDA